MVSAADYDAVPSWFITLPDCESAGPVGAALRDQATREISHPSGGPGCSGAGTRVP